jgi:hypothetical protein
VPIEEVGENCDLFYLDVLSGGPKFVKPTDQKIKKGWVEKMMPVIENNFGGK